MDELMKKFDDLLAEYNLTINDVIKMYERRQIKTRRLTQCYADSENMWQYCNGVNNPCGCGCNCFHYEYDRIDNKVYGVCNGCKTAIYELKEEYLDEKLHTGVWLAK